MNAGDTGSAGETAAVPSGNAGVKLAGGGVGVDGISVGSDSSECKTVEVLCNGEAASAIGVWGKMPSLI